LKKKILALFTDSFYPICDGVATVVYNYALYLSRMNFEVVVVSVDFPGIKDGYNFIVQRIPSIPIPFRKPYRVGFSEIARDVVRDLEKINFDIIHSHSPFSVGRLGLKIAKERKVPIIGSFHSKYYDDFIAVVKSKFITNLILKWIVNFYNQCDEVWTVNNATVKTLKEYGYRKENIFVAENGVNLNENTLSEEIVERDFYLNKNDFVLLYVGQHVVQKNVFLILKALKILKEKNLNFKMIFAGDGNAKKKMTFFVKKNKLESFVCFAGKIAERSYLNTLYKRANLFVFPSLYDTSGIVVREAALFGCPSVLVKNSNAASGVIDEYNGFLIENTPASLAEKIENLLNKREILKKVGENARISLAVSWEKIMDVVAERYNHILKEFQSK